MRNRYSSPLLLAIFVLPLGLAAAQPAAGQRSNTTPASEHTVMVGGAAMYPSKNIIENAVNSKDHTTLVAAVKAAGLVPTLEGPGPFTVFAPTNEAFDKLPPGTVATLLKPENKEMLTKILTYHVVAGQYTLQGLMKLVQQGEGVAVLKTVEGEPLKISSSNGHIYVEGAKSGVAEVTIPNVVQSNGVIQVVNSVLLPN
jgi:uncharacterized surface protein with fasciclin (FAS1) repeats